MTVKELREAYEDISAILSGINRQLCFAGIAVVWIFNKSSYGLNIPEDLYWPTLLFVSSLFLDVVQYVYQTIVTYVLFLGYKFRKKKKDDDSVGENEGWYYPSWAFFILKIIALVWGYVKIGEFLINKM